MSMLTEQCVRLRSWAKQFDERADFDALAPLLASDLREAADTIEDLRDRLQNQAFAHGMQEALGGVTCEYVIEDNMNESEGMGDVWFRCTNCGACYDYMADNWMLKKTSHCPKCGATVKGVK